MTKKAGDDSTLFNNWKRPPVLPDVKRAFSIKEHVEISSSLSYLFHNILIGLDCRKMDRESKYLFKNTGRSDFSRTDKHNGSIYWFIHFNLLVMDISMRTWPTTVNNSFWLGTFHTTSLAWSSNFLWKYLLRVGMWLTNQWKLIIN